MGCRQNGTVPPATSVMDYFYLYSIDSYFKMSIFGWSDVAWSSIVLNAHAKNTTILVKIEEYVQSFFENFLTSHCSLSISLLL